MQRNTGIGNGTPPSGGHYRSKLQRTIAALVIPLAVGAGFSFLPAVQAADNSLVDGSSGVLHIHGSLTESACRLDMDSAWQDVELGNLATGRLQNVGDRGKPVMVQLKLRDCLSAPSHPRDERTGSQLWSTDQPAVSVSFMALADESNPQLIRVQGAGGLALRMMDFAGRDIQLGSQGKSLLLVPGQNTLNYTLVPERTRAPLRTGTWWALMRFGLTYD